MWRKRSWFKLLRGDKTDNDCTLTHSKYLPETKSFRKLEQQPKRNLAWTGLKSYQKSYNIMFEFTLDEPEGFTRKSVISQNNLTWLTKKVNVVSRWKHFPHDPPLLWLFPFQMHFGRGFYFQKAFENEKFNQKLITCTVYYIPRKLVISLAVRKSNLKYFPPMPFPLPMIWKDYPSWHLLWEILGNYKSIKRQEVRLS